MLQLTRDLCSIRTAVVADGNASLFARIAQELPIDLFRFPSGQMFNGWLVPQNWRVKRAKIFRGNTEVFDAGVHALGVGYYSKSFMGELEWDQLAPKLVTNADLPDALMFHCMWQYRPWDADWAISVPHRIYRTLGPGRYRVELETEYEAGEMLVAHCHKAGSSEKTIVFNAHTCHPHMANDGLAATAVLIRLMQRLMSQDTYYSYRLVLGPEHLGTVFYLRDLSLGDIDRLVGGIFEEMPGTLGPIKATSTFTGGLKLDTAVANALKHHSRDHTLVPWRKGAGNDETVWEAPGYEVPFVEITRCEDQFAPFREYHSNLDTPDLMDERQLDEMLLVMEKIVDALEHDVVMHRQFDGLICLSNPEYDLYMERPDPAVVKDLAAHSENWGHLLDCMLRYFDGGMSVLEIAERHNLPFDQLRKYIGRFEQKGLVRLERADISRRIPSRVKEPLSL